MIDRIGGRRLRVLLALGALGVFAVSVETADAVTSSIPARFAMQPSPIGTAATTKPSTSRTVTVTAESLTGAHEPGAALWLSFQPAVGGGTAYAGTTVLTRKPTEFIADSQGQVGVVFTTPPTFPMGSVDVLHAQNAATQATSTASARDSFCYSTIATMAFSPRPISLRGSLLPNSTIPVTLTVFSSKGILPNSVVYLTFLAAPGGGSAMVGGRSVSANATAFTTSSAGQVVVSYTTPPTLPASGSDRLIAGDSPRDQCVVARDEYKYS